MDWYQLWKLLHVLSAIVAVGANVTYFVWLTAIRGRPQLAQSFALETIAKVERRLANPAYAILPLTGVIMVLTSQLGFTTFWIAVAIGLYVAMGVVGGALFTPSLRRLTAIVNTEGPDAPGYAEEARRTTVRGTIVVLLVVAIVALMVLKPTV